MTASTPLARPRTERLPLRPSALALLASALVTGLVCVLAVSSAPETVRTALGWGSALAAAVLCAAVVAVTRARQSRRMLRSHIEALHADAGRRDLERARLAGENTRLAEETKRAGTERAAALAACANAAARMQALATGMLADLRDMEHRHTGEDVLSDLFHLDHRTAQAGRLADSIAVLTGARSGRRWARPIVMESILRGAMGRVSGYQRIRVHSSSEVSVAGHAAEGVMHALAELLDNAANFSPPTAEVHVYVEEVPAGVIVSVEDSGLVMSEVQQRRAEHAVTGKATDLSGLSGTRLGLAVVGRLSRKHGLTVSFRPSARGGTGVLILLPQELLTRPSDARDTAPGMPHSPALGHPMTESLPLPPEAAPGDTATTTGAPTGTTSPTTATAKPTARVTPPAPAAPTTPPTGTPVGTVTPTDHTRPADTPGTAGPTRPADTTRSSASPTPRPSPDSAAPASPEVGDSGLPRRRRGQTLAAAHPDGAPPSRRSAPDPVDAKTRADRFSSFRQAVRATSPHPEGNDSR